MTDPESVSQNSDEQTPIRHARAGEYFTVNKIVEREVASHTRARDQNRLFAGFASRVTRHSCELSA